MPVVSDGLSGSQGLGEGLLSLVVAPRIVGQLRCTQQRIRHQVPQVHWRLRPTSTSLDAMSGGFLHPARPLPVMCACRVQFAAGCSLPACRLTATPATCLPEPHCWTAPSGNTH